MSEIRLLSLAEAAATDSWAGMCGPADLFCTPEWFAVEQDASGPWVPAANGCLAVYDDDRLLAGVTLQQFDLAVDDDTVRVDRMLRTVAADRLAGVTDAELAGALLPSLMCGGWFNSRVLTRPGAPDEAVRRLLARAVATGEEWGSACVLLPYVDGSDTRLLTELRQAGFVELPAPARHVFDCDYPSYDAYLATLPSRRRVRVRKELRRFDQAGVTTGHVPLDDSTLEQVAVLAHNLDRKYEQASTVDQLAAWFSAITKSMNASVFTATLEGRLFAMTMWLHHEDRLYGFHAGFDYTVGRGLPMYSVVGYHLPIAHGCLSPEITVLEYGISADEAKLLRGTRALPQVLAVKPLSARAEAVVEKLPGVTRVTVPASRHNSPRRS